MKPSHLQTPRTLADCWFPTGYAARGLMASRPEPLGTWAGIALGFVLGALLTAVSFAWWSA